MFLVIYLFFLIYPISVDLAGRIPISASLPAIDCRLHYALLTKRESTRCRILDKFVFFFFAFFMNTRCQCPESWPNKVNTSKGMYKKWTKENFLPRDFIFNAENPEWVRSGHLAHSGSQSEQRNRFILRPRGFSHIYNKIAYYYFLSTWDLWKHPSFLPRVSTILG